MLPVIGVEDPDMVLDYSESKWQTVDTLVRFCQAIQNRIGAGTWLCVFDHAPVHISEEFVSRIATEVYTWAPENVFHHLTWAPENVFHHLTWAPEKCFHHLTWAPQNIFII